jgi:thiopurine S-methyltransferase
MTETWLERWEVGRIGWHESEGNRGLKANWTASGKNVLVPLCGKAPDLLWLAELDNRVTGVELSPIAARGFFDDNALEYRLDETGPLPVYVGRNVPVRIVCGDYFSFDETGFDAHYDRGALVALPRDRRGAYSRHTLERLVPEPLQCVITVDYDETLADGPPFVVREAELLGTWPALRLCDEYDDSESMPPKFSEAGVTRLVEKVWMSPG